jgi:cell division transport system permease protein
MTELPFMLETMIASVIGGIIAVGLIGLGKWYVLDDVLAHSTSNNTIPNLGANEVLIAGGIGVIAGLVLSALTAIVTLRVYVKV